MACSPEHGYVFVIVVALACASLLAAVNYLVTYQQKIVGARYQVFIDESWYNSGPRQLELIIPVFRIKSISTQTTQLYVLLPRLLVEAIHL